ncbi:hypothetical protein PDG61_17420 [Mycolicibacterium sp. BiH015]|uniref:hypothetical protein n=1 Tax=Mycolicibacterium sp. BiH015 TaxID=3018808 RepID=UPI0022E5F0AB|nr:hypothetical protein [Mycolicibacterium sp. BiH015]MDA2892703.1 hypothetical protein [Mycolicibacterium sp. BiH015]
MATSMSLTLTESTDGLLRLAMRADALLSGATGLVLLVLGRQVAELSGTTAAVEYTTGASFVIFSLVVLALAARPRVRAAGMVLAVGNALFTVATVAVVLADVWPLTDVGVALVLGTGVYTLAMAALQYAGVRRIPA